MLLGGGILALSWIVLTDTVFPSSFHCSASHFITSLSASLRSILFLFRNLSHHPADPFLCSCCDFSRMSFARRCTPFPHCSFIHRRMTRSCSRTVEERVAAVAVVAVGGGATSSQVCPLLDISVAALASACRLWRCCASPAQAVSVFPPHWTLASPCRPAHNSLLLNNGIVVCKYKFHLFGDQALWCAPTQPPY